MPGIASIIYYKRVMLPRNRRAEQETGTGNNVENTFSRSLYW
jgi:hypothetical protein